MIRTMSSRTRHFQIMSDLHLETFKEYSTFQILPMAPRLILAGDVGRLSDYDLYLSFLRSQCEVFIQVFLVLGNHEFFGISHEQGLHLAKSLEIEPALNGRLVVLSRRRVDLKSAPGITILGCTLQSHIPDDARQVVEAKINDFKRIKGWTVDDHNREHSVDIDWLRAEICAIRKERDGHKRRIVVVTHHAPSLIGTSKPADVGSPWSSAFGTDLFQGDGATTFREVQWWIFGHTHYTTTFSKYTVRFVSNQRGQLIGREPNTSMLPNASPWAVTRWVSWISPKHSKKDDTFDVRKVILV